MERADFACGACREYTASQIASTAHIWPRRKPETFPYLPITTSNGDKTVDALRRMNCDSLLNTQERMKTNLCKNENLILRMVPHWHTMNLKQVHTQDTVNKPKCEK